MAAGENAADIAAPPRLALLGAVATLIHFGGDGGVAQRQGRQPAGRRGPRGAQLGHRADEELFADVIRQHFTDDRAVRGAGRGQLRRAQGCGAGELMTVGKGVDAVKSVGHVAGARRQFGQ